MRIIAGEARGRTIVAPEGKNTRPTLDRIRENMFNMIQGHVIGRRVLDLFAGSGALSLEAISRGAESAVLCDRDPKALKAEEQNIATLRMEDRTRIIRGEWERTLATLRGEGATFDLVFLDPPYAMTDLTVVFEGLRPMLEPDAWIILEHEAGTAVAVGDGVTLVKERTWGYCGVKIYTPEGSNGE